MIARRFESLKSLRLYTRSSIVTNYKQAHGQVIITNFYQILTRQIWYISL
ncbi:hypothetical protein OSCI_3180029 [Kamptonema sp. PCC 6506]|nr:hypothetical protein OSCI_3180029 [Kamptonema sp. PCC 6506]